MCVSCCIVPFHFLDQSFAETKDWDQTALLWSQSGVESNQSQQCTSLHNVVIADIFVFLVCLWIMEKMKWYFVHQNLISNRLTYLVHAKSAGELISFGFSDRSVQSLVSANRFAETKREKNDCTFWLISGLSPDLGLSKRLIQKVKWPIFFVKIWWHHLSVKVNYCNSCLYHFNCCCQFKWPNWSV